MRIPLIEVHYNSPTNIADGFGTKDLSSPATAEDPALETPDSDDEMCCIVLADNLMVCVNEAMVDHLLVHFDTPLVERVHRSIKEHGDDFWQDEGNEELFDEVLGFLEKDGYTLRLERIVD